MKRFIKLFFASLLALIVLTVIIVALGVWFISASMHPEKPDLGAKGVLVLDLSLIYNEQAKNDPLASFTGEDNSDAPGLYDVIRMLHYAKTDTTIKGVYIKADYNPNGFATSEELQKALLDFKQSKKFIYAYGETLDQKSYYVSTAADKVYCHPAGGIDWDGFSVTYMFMKGLLDKIGVQPQVFYAGKFKSATEPFRVTAMTDANRQQTNEFLNDLYSNYLLAAAKARNIDTATLHDLANRGAIRTAYDAVSHHLIDGVKYDDEMKAVLLKKLGLKKEDKINFISLSKYAKAADFNNSNASDEVAIIYAQGDIVNGKGDDDQIGSDDFVDLLRKARLNKDVKGIIVRVNSPGGSSLASDAIWREITLAKDEKPLVVSMGNYAASGGYYISCNADSIFADATTITGSIGVYSIIPNFQPLFNDKLGLNFDGVKTAPYADMGATNRPLTEVEKRFMQSSVDSIYQTFKTRVANGRTKDLSYIDSIAQGHVYTGKRAIPLALVDKIGGLQDAVNCVARMAKLQSYQTKEYPEKKSFLQQVLNSSHVEASVKENAIKNKLGTAQYNMLLQINKIQQLMQTPQARMAFDLDIH
ncbi:signal peptide peptidase SppA [Limnovirga soli]|uniref:Signal peptide peptidase SppA n=1 Tax=Limnovirga soli TaxID=2656915 RepID=A0A8J8FII4_9BACT|nr:signal peptide peptidase SppA [Limnovirga soli]NNV57833.1 signal peptide peptidase SppA [Limnovirga soli]